jgi:pyridoxal phosphate enzyme (YggS family)
MKIAENIHRLRKEIPAEIQIVAVSKNQEPGIIRVAYDAGQRSFGENKVQEIIRKFPTLPPDIEWHFIGHLQSNKVRFLAPFVHCIHSVDSLKLLKEIDLQAKIHSRTIRCLLQFHIAREETKFGLTLGEAQEILCSEAYRAMENVTIDGVMGMATYTEDEKTVQGEFRELHHIFDSLKKSFFPDAGHFRERSMGMSSDYRIAINEGSTMLRIGSSIFC